MKIISFSIATRMIVFLMLVTAKVSNCQVDGGQTVRGTVVDIDTQTPVPGATVVLDENASLKGTITDEKGAFILENIAFGRYSIVVRHISYIPVTKDILVHSSKEVILNIELEQKIAVLDQAIIKPELRKDKTINKMVTASARSFTIDETSRYAGSLGDPSKMASNFAGVTSVDDNRNDIIIRGNSPTGLLWMIDGVVVQNPNHFGSRYSTGGSVTVLNNNLLTNSDFITSAFTAEYGNAISGVFDLKMRSGNSQNREYWIQAGWNGFELGAEGGINMNKNSSYMACYRYSILDIIQKADIDIGYTPEYQDFTFKLDFPDSKIGHLSMWGIGGHSHIEIFDSKEENKNDWSFSNFGEDITFTSDLGILALSNKVQINSNTRIHTNISICGTRHNALLERFLNIGDDKYIYTDENDYELKHAVSSAFFKRINVKNFLQAGVILDFYDFSYIDSIFSYPDNEYFIIDDVKGKMELIQLYMQWKHKFSDILSITNGVHYQQLFYNNTYSIEPRLGAVWSYLPNQSLNFGFGMHSLMPPKMIYFIKSEEDPDSKLRSNKNLGFTRSVHTVIGYNYLIKKDLRLKIEGYYQHLYDIPVKNDTASAYSLINEGASFSFDPEDSLVNKGTGANFGIELTLEKFFSNNYYILVTASIFNSKYFALDKVKRNTIFNGNYVFNLLSGKEHSLNKNFELITGIKATWTGGKRYVPYDIQKTVEYNKAYYEWEKAYENKQSDYIRIDLKCGIRLNKPAYFLEFVMDFQNLTNHRNIFMERIDPMDGAISKDYQVGFFPMGTIKLQF